MAPGAVFVEQGRQRDRLARLARTGHGVERVQGLLALLVHEDPHGAAAHQADARRLLVRDAVRHDLGLLAGEDPLRLLHQRALHASAGHRALDVPAIVDEHLRARIERGRADPLDQHRVHDPPSLAQPGRGDALGGRQRAQVNSLATRVKDHHEREAQRAARRNHAG